MVRVAVSFADLLADRLSPPPPPGKDAAFSLLGYEPTCKPRELARKAGITPLPEPCGQCPQELFHAATEYDVLYGGAAGGGKTKALVMDFLADCWRFPRLRSIIFRRSFDELAESVIPELMAVDFGAALGGDWNKTAHQITFANGAILRLRYIEHLEDAGRRLGGQYQKVGFEERTQIVPGAAGMIRERIRSFAGGPPVLGVRSTSNPGSQSHAEVKARYIDATNHGEKVVVGEKGHTIRFIPAKATDNTHLDDDYLNVLDTIEDPARRAAMRDGSWDSFAGMVFTEWNRDRHVVHPFTIPPEWDRYAGVDYGYDHPWAVVWLARDQDSRLWVYRELYERMVGELEQTRLIKEAEEGDPPSYKVGDPSMGRKTGDAETIMSTYTAEGVHLDPAENDRLAGWSRLHSLLAEGPACAHHRAQGWETCPRIHFFAGCRNVIREISSAVYSSVKAEDVAKVNDDALDALRYACMAVGGQATFFVPHDEGRAVALDGTPLHEPFGPYAKPPEEETPQWFIPQ